MSDTTDSNDRDIAEARAIRREVIETAAETRVIRDTQLAPLWARIMARREQNDFGREYELSLTPRNKGAA